MNDIMGTVSDMVYGAPNDNNNNNNNQPQQPQLQRQDSNTNAHTVAQTLQGGNQQEIRNLLNKHQVTPVAQNVFEQNAPQATTTNQFKVRERNTQNYRKTGQNTFRKVKQFDLLPTNENNQDTVSATFFPMTGHQQAWDNNENGNKTPNMGRIQSNNIQQNLGITSPLSGCSVARLNNGNMVHVQPFKAGNRNDMEQAEQTLRNQANVNQVFGPTEYGKIANSQPSNEVKTTSMFMLKGNNGQMQGLAQSFHHIHYHQLSPSDKFNEVKLSTHTKDMSIRQNQNQNPNNAQQQQNANNVPQNRQRASSFGQQQNNNIQANQNQRNRSASLGSNHGNNDVAMPNAAANNNLQQPQNNQQQQRQNHGQIAVNQGRGRSSSNPMQIRNAPRQPQPMAQNDNPLAPTIKRRHSLNK